MRSTGSDSTLNVTLGGLKISRHLDHYFHFSSFRVPNACLHRSVIEAQPILYPIGSGFRIRTITRI